VKVRYRVHNSLSLVSILRQMNSINILPSHVFKSILILILQYTATSSWCSLFFRVSYQNLVYSLYVLMHAICAAHFIVLDLTEPGAWGYNWATLPLGGHQYRDLVLQSLGLHAKPTILLCKKDYCCEIQKSVGLIRWNRQIWQDLPRRAMFRKGLFCQ
jgi:hypothetical protein